MTFNPFSPEKTKELIKTFRQQYQELKKEDYIEFDEDDEELGPQELLAIEYINQMTNAGSYLDDMERYVQRQLNRHARANGCGRKEYTTKINGQPGCVIWECTDHRLCSRCRKKRAEELIGALRYHHYHSDSLSIGEFLKFKDIHEADYDKYSKRAQRAKIKYGKINQPNNRILLFSTGDINFGEDLIDYDNDGYGQIDWDKILEQIPMGRNISGSIWIKPGAPGDEEEAEGDGEGEEEVEKEMIPTLHFNTNATEQEINLAYHKAAAETQVIATSIKELQKALFNRTRIWQEKIGKEKCGDWMDYRTWVSEKDIEIWNKAIVSNNHIENNDIDNVDNKAVQKAKRSEKELMPVEQLALVK